MELYIPPALSDGFYSPEGVFQMGVENSTLTPEITIIGTSGGEWW